MTDDVGPIEPSSGALVSVGVPVFNEAPTLQRAVESLRRQTHENLEIIISDNASTDGTAELAQALAASDDRVRCHRHPESLGPAGNFRFVLEQSRGEFFMWAAGDDYWDETFVDRNLSALLADDGLVASVSRVGWTIDGEPAGLAAGTSPLDGTLARNVVSYLRTARDNSRFYGLFRRDALVASFPRAEFLGLDHAVVLGTLRYGRHHEVDDVLMTRRRNDPASYAVDPERVQGSAIERRFPLLPFTRHVRQLGLPLRPAAIMWLVVRNIYEHLRMSAKRRSAYGRLARMALWAARPVQRRATKA